MNEYGSPTASQQNIHGIQIRVTNQHESDVARQTVKSTLQTLRLENDVKDSNGTMFEGYMQWTLKQDYIQSVMPELNTIDLSERLGLQPHSNPSDLYREIWLAMLANPTPWIYPSVDELISAIRVRTFIVDAASKTALNFNASEAERPNDCWTYHENTSFTVLPGSPLIEALIKATQPGPDGTVYSFSCYRATEYVQLLALAQEAQISNPALLAAMQQQWETRAVMSGKFHDVFLKEVGTMEDPLPIRYYIPGDRIWFRNPDDPSSDVAGFEGSWVLYLGGGLFPNFWRRNKPFTLESKCVDVYHWRNSTFRDTNGELQMNESRVSELLDQTMTQPAEVAKIMRRMYRLRDPKGVYENGGCMDTSREFLRWVRPSTCDIIMPGYY